MIKALLLFFARRFNYSIENSAEKNPSPIELESEVLSDSESDFNSKRTLVPYDENLLERSRTQWQLGDWESLAKLDRDTFQHHPDRAKLALLAAAGKLQLGQNSEAAQFVRLAKDWGIGKHLLRQILISGAYNSLGKAAALAGQNHRANKCFENAIVIGATGGDIGLMCRELTIPKQNNIKLQNIQNHLAQ